jgi:hypothetical protein
VTTTILQIMQGVETRLATITSPRLRVSDTVPDAIDPATTGGFAIVGVPAINYRLTMGRAKYEIPLSITVLTSAAVSRIGQQNLAQYADPRGANSVIVVIEADPTLGGLVEQCWLTEFRPLGTEEVGVIGYFGGLFSGFVIPSGA